MDEPQVKFPADMPEKRMTSLLDGFEELISKMKTLTKEDQGTLLLGFYSGAACAANMIGYPMVGKSVPISLAIAYKEVNDELHVFMDGVKGINEEFKREFDKKTKH